MKESWDVYIYYLFVHYMYEARGQITVHQHTAASQAVFKNVRPSWQHS